MKDDEGGVRRCGWEWCQRPLPPPRSKSGRPQRYCLRPASCREQAYRARRRRAPPPS